eukprot:CAMPEP_0170513006 /NCGR_PEP_ID=MMETSP0208-20121228/67164_1 /TAXON_ID=197538 /ORGANISM="Strombidium inclinatum, Strain S3" /LENGTH=73 /DNA_ID=CAMNT_0010796693 /DNA_START=115 /DNA_END=336 /DNA_ORIENTATION=+
MSQCPSVRGEIDDQGPTLLPNNLEGESGFQDALNDHIKDFLDETNNQDSENPFMKMMSALGSSNNYLDLFKEN